MDSTTASEHDRLLWSERADLVHVAFDLADSSRQAAAAKHLGGPRFPDLIQVSQAVHLLAGMPAGDLNHPLQRLVDGLDLRLRPAVLAREAPGRLEARTTHTLSVVPLAPGVVSEPLMTTLTWQCGTIARHGRQEPVEGGRFAQRGFEMYLPDPRRVDDPLGPWTVVPSFVSNGRRFVGLPLQVPVAGMLASAGSDPSGGVMAAVQTAAQAASQAAGQRSLAALIAPLGIEPLTLGAESGAGSAAPMAWRQTKSGDGTQPWTGTLLFPTHFAESAAGPLIGLVGDRWRADGPAGFEKVALALKVFRSPEFATFLAQRRARGPVVLVLRGDSPARWLLGRLKPEVPFDGVVLASSFPRPSRAISGGSPTLWVGSTASDLPDVLVRGITGLKASFLDEPLLPARVAEWLELEQKAGAIRR